MSIVAIIASLIMGIVLGLLGGGGSILAVPILVFLLGVAPKAAIATSLLVVAATSAAGAVSHARAGNVEWKTGFIFGGFAMVGAFTGGAFARYIPGNVLLFMFGALMVVTAIAMLRSKKRSDDETSDAPEGSRAPRDLPIAKIGAEGFVVGGITGLVGAGGGFLVVPALVLLGGLPMRKAIGTSLMVIAMKSMAGFAGYAAHVTVDFHLVGIFVAAAVVGTLVGTWLAKGIDAAKLRTGFAYFVLAMGTFVIGQKVGLIDLGKPMPDAHAVAVDGEGSPHA